MRSMPFAFLVLVALPVQAAEDQTSLHLSEMDGLRILHAWTSATSDKQARVYFDLENTGTRSATLLGGATEIAAQVHLKGVDIYNPGKFTVLNGVPMPAQTRFSLSPNLAFLELRDVDRPLVEGDAFDMKVLIDPIGEIEIHVEIEAADATRHSHAGHTH